MGDRILTMNGGSSTIKFAVLSSSDEPQCILTGKIDGIRRADTGLSATDIVRAQRHRVAIKRPAKGGHAPGIVLIEEKYDIVERVNSSAHRHLMEESGQ